MEVIAGWTHRAFPIDDPSQVGAARRHAANLAQAIALSETEAGRLAVIVTELGTNLLRHARKGRLLIAARSSMNDVEVLSVDEGPGIADVTLAMRDGHSSGSTPGTGLGAVQRLATYFEMHSSTPDGTLCVARVGNQSTSGCSGGAFAIGAVCLPVPGESECGDGWAVAIDGDAARVIVADGLGHGPEAAKASKAATTAFAGQPFAGLRETIQTAHVALQATRGAAVCAASLDATASSLTYVGAGNVVGRVVSGVFDKSLITQHGTVGQQIRRPEESKQEWPTHALVILQSDGIETRWKAQTIAPLLMRDPALVAALLLRDHSRQRDDATVVVLRRRSNA